MTAKSFLSSVFLLIFSVVCFSFAHPGVVFARGLFVFGWIAYIPVFVLLKRCTVRTAFCWGAAYGFLRFFVLMYWLFAYRLGGLVGLCLAMAAETAVLFALCVAVGRFFRRYFPRAFGVAGWLVAPALFLLFDWLRTLGELGFSYGVIGYSQWQVAPLVRSARFFGVWGVSFAIMVFGAWVAFVLSQYLQKEKWKHLHGLLLVCFSWIENPYRLGRMRIRIPDDVARRLVPIFFRGAFIFGIFLLIFFSGKLFLRVPPAPLGEAPSFSVALIQPNSDPWKDGVVAYREELRALMTLTDKALAEHPETQLVVWSETAFVPDIVRHYTERADAERFVLVAELLQYIESKNCAFVLGNNHAEQATSAAEGRVSNFNSALYFEPHSNVLPPEPVVYSKMRLVPFSEQVPYARIFAPVARLFDPEPHYWDAGTAATIFETQGIRFCAPICFEDTFAPDIKNMCRAGAQLIVNLSNDSWSHSLACQNQHLAMAVFRSAENGVPTIRSTASGQTCIIDARGRVVAEIPPFEAGYLCGTVTVGN